MAKNGSKGPKISKKLSYSHSISMKYIVVSQKTLPTYIIVKPDQFLKFLGYFGPFFAILSQNMRCFSPAFFYFQWLTVTSFHALIIHNIQWIAFFAKIFTKWGPFWVPWFFCICFYWDVYRKGFLRNNYLFHGIKTEKWPYFWNLGLIWPILGIF